MQQHHHASSTSHAPSYAVYSFQHQESQKKGSQWRVHGHCEQKDEALWIAEQLSRCEEVARVEIRLQGLDEKTNKYKDKCIKQFKKETPQKSLLARLFSFFK
ncbi:MAG: hypothetical protein CMH25_03745 [Micavibrio sp.]|nr:hypothetical protein [Micavibrio sp.]|tara:strand:+ start:735494 stop:735799 length:306 start_codon:yes stop_codon:yes gene_type:complete